MEPVIVLVVGVCWLAAVVYGSRQAARGRRGWAWVWFVPGMASLGLVVWVAIRNLADQPLLAIVLGLISVPSLLLFVRMARQQTTDVLPSDPAWKLSSAQFDYIVWMAIGLPFLAIAGLILLLIGGALGVLK